VLWLGTPAPQLLALPQGRRVLRFDLAAPDAQRTRLALRNHWQRLMPAGSSEDEVVLAALDRAGRQFHLGRAALDNVLERVQAAAPAERAAEIWAAAREAARDGLDGIAQRVETRVTLDDVVLPSGQSAMLRDIARHLQQRDRVYGEWGFGAKHQLGQGLVVLFAGESGTGKTLAAEAIANEVDLDLYRVDLATLVSKYIGETEKNLKRLFDAAEVSGAVLLFDEADALFGKRSEVKDSHDRYANIEVAYLLQRVEAYRGLAVLTTNMKSALDQAFLRRIRFIVSFPFPDAASREQIWRRQFPPDAPLGEVDFTALARLNLPGGNIRSIAVNAAFKAADAGTRIEQSLLATAAHEEFAKLERSMGSAAMGGMA
jgi:SpoVK/Ycf46/Vps4 family AAA+-type ATPase